MLKKTPLRLERLEGREVPATISLNAGGLFISKQTGALTITATADNTVTVTDGAKVLGPFAVGNIYITGTASANSVKVDLGAFTLGGSITADAGAGNDTVSVVAAGGTLGGNLIVRGGVGNDTLLINADAGGAVGTFGGMVIVDGNVGNDTVNFGNDTGATDFGGNVLVTAANSVQLSSSQDDTFGGNVVFTPGVDLGVGLTMQEGAVGGTNNITIDGNLTLVSNAAADTIFLRGMQLNGDLMAVLGGGANKLAISSSAATVTTVNNNLTYVGGAGSDTVDLRGGTVNNNATLTLFDGNDEVDLQGFGGQPTVIGNNLFINDGSGTLTIGAIDAQIGNNFWLTQGSGDATLDFTAASSVGGSINVRAGSGKTSLILEGAQAYFVNADLGAGADSVTLNNAGATLSGRIDGGAGTDDLVVTNGTLLADLRLISFP